MILLAVAPANQAAPVPDLFGGFAEGWRESWREQKLLTKATVYEKAVVDGRPVLHARSEDAGSGFLREIALPNPRQGQLSWRWKIAQPLTTNPGERSRSGDDYAARVFVVFETSMIPLRTRAINYVWAAHEPAGTVFASPYTSKVAMIVLRSGGTDAGSWQIEKRDLLADYRAFFGEPPREINAVAVMVDTDNTGLTAEAWFADLRLEATPR